MLYITRKEHAAIKALVGYLEADEARSYEEADAEGKAKHIYHSIRALHKLAGMPIL